MYVKSHYMPRINNMTTSDASEVLEGTESTKYRSGVRKLMHMMQYSRPEIYNTVRDLARHMKSPMQVHYNAMLRVMKYCVETPNRGRNQKGNGTGQRNTCLL